MLWEILALTLQKGHGAPVVRAASMFDAQGLADCSGSALFLMQHNSPTGVFRGQPGASEGVPKPYTMQCLPDGCPGFMRSSTC